jgi:hypothetical protein
MQRFALGERALRSPDSFHVVPTPRAAPPPPYPNGTLCFFLHFSKSYRVGPQKRPLSISSNRSIVRLEFGAHF